MPRKKRGHVQEHTEPSAPRVCIIDTNVAIVANARDNRIAPECVIACGRALRHFSLDQSMLAIDNQWLIIDEYKNRLNQSGQPGLGDAFLKWVLTNMWNTERCVQVPITPDPSLGFGEFPASPELSTFDLSDRKFVAVALAHRDRPPIFEATDSDWWHARDALQAEGVEIRFLCRADIRRKGTKR